MQKIIDEIKSRIASAADEAGRPPDAVRILAATKTVPISKINEAVKCGITLVGENRVQEFIKKAELVKNAEWHFIGGLQTNKVKFLIGKVALIHSVDRINLADEIQRLSSLSGIKTRVLIEINAGGEQSKSGVTADGIEPLYEYIKDLPNVEVCGFMPVMPIGAKDELYAKMNGIFCEYKAKDAKICELSMGMSGDFITAVRYGATIVRLGSILFGQRDYN